MKALLQSIAASMVRALLPLVSVWLIDRGGLSEGQVAELAAGITGLFAAGLWIIWTNVTRKVELNTALAVKTPGTTLEGVKDLIKGEGGTKAAASALTPPDRVPVLVEFPVAPKGRD